MKGNIISQLLSNFHKSLKGINSLAFKIIYSVTHPVKGLENLIRLLKNRAFSLVLFFGSGVLIYLATMDFLPVLLTAVYPDMTAEAARSKSMQIALFSEILLGISKIKKLKWTSAGLILLVMSLSMSGFIIELSSQWVNLSSAQIFVQILFGLGLNGLPVIATWIFGNDASKVPAKKRRKKRNTQKDSAEQRAARHASILEAFDSGQFTTLGEIAEYSGVKQETVTRVLKKERETEFAEFKAANSAGRKPKKRNFFRFVFGQ